MRDRRSAWRLLRLYVMSENISVSPTQTCHSMGIIIMTILLTHTTVLYEMYIPSGTSLLFDSYI